MVLSLLSATMVVAQVNKHTGQPIPTIKCATEDAIQRQYQTDPAFRALMDQRERDFQTWKAANQGRLNEFARTSTLTGPVVIPIVFHIVLTNPNIVSDADCQYVVDRLNIDFAGINADSTNGVPFYGVRGHSLIRFCLAKRDPAGNFTTGIERKVGTAGIAGGEPQPLKSVATGGLNPWDVTRYYNVWVGTSTGGILGIAPAIGVGTAASDGVCVNVQSFAGPAAASAGNSGTPASPGSCAPVIAAFNLGRTAVHEIGHNFGLYHTFSGCSDGADMAQLTSPSCQLPPTILSLPDDTPQQSTPTSGCPTGTVASNCAGAPNPPGKQYQNYMDYTDDACYSMFSKTQVERMHWVLENCRVGYLTSNGCTPPASIATLDGAITEIVNPGGSETLAAPTCTTINYALPTCPGPITPRVRVQNVGTTTLTSVTINYVIGATNVTTTYPVNLATGKSAVIVLGAVPTALGANTLTATITQVNATVDPVTANNSLAANFTLVGPSALPRTADFVAATFPPVGFTINNPNANNTWVRNANGNGNAGSAFIDYYNFNQVGQFDEIRSTPASVPAGTTEITVKFDLAHKNFPGFNDNLSVWYSTDCGVTWTTTGYSKSGAVLATAGTSTANYTTPAAADWRTETISFTNAVALAAGQIQFAIRGTNGYGNNIFVDNINISVPVNRDMTVTSVNTPGANECSPTFTPSVTVKNNGLLTVNSYQVGYIIDAGAPATTPLITTPLAPGASATIPLPIATAAIGNHTIKAYTYNLTATVGTGDQNIINDTLSKAFVVRALFNAPVSEGFEGAAFPSAGWAIINPNANVTFVKVTNAGGFGASSSSMFIDNYNFNLVGQQDALVSVPLNCTNADSVVVTFDLAHKNFAGFNDSLLVIFSNNCGTSYFRSAYAKGGASLATAGASTANYTAPAAGDWRKERIAIGGAALANGNIIIGLLNRNGYGNNVFIDNINLSLIYRRDIQAVSALRPNNAECTGSFTPAITVKNNGLDTVKSFTASYRVDGGAVVNTNITGLNLLSGVTANYNLTPITGLAVGIHTITMYTSLLVTNGGTGDQFLLNDTTFKSFNVIGTQAAPLVQNFEGTFAPAGWGINNADNSTTFTQANIGFNSTKSATVQNYTYTGAATATKLDELLTPNVTYTGVDSVYLSFDLAAMTKQYPGYTGVGLDSLEVLLSKDCGATFTSVFNKWGEDLQTVNDPNYSNPTSFAPTNNEQWKNIKLNITGAAGTSSTGLVVFFRNKSNNDNNVYIDNINLTTLTLPASLKTNGYLLYPSPFSGSFNVQHFLTPTDLRFIEVYDSRGRIVYRKQFGNGGANSSEKVDLYREAAGVYTVKLGYTNKMIVERIIKTN
jgi:hypothetical protein